MQYIIDIALAAVFVITVVISAKKGFFITLFELAAYIVSLVTAKLFSATLAPQVYEAAFSTPLSQKVTQLLGEAGSKDYVSQIQSAADKIPDWASGIMEMIGIDKDALVSQLSQSDFSGSNAVESIMNKIVSPVVTAIIQTLLFVIIALVITVVLRIVVKLLNKVIKKLPAIKQINSGLGAVLGAVKGLLVVMLLALVILTLSGVTGLSEFADGVNDSLIIKSIGGLLKSISGYTG